MSSDLPHVEGQGALAPAWGGEGLGQAPSPHVSSQGRPGTIAGLEGSADFLVRGRAWGGANAGRGRVRWRGAGKEVVSI